MEKIIRCNSLNNNFLHLVKELDKELRFRYCTAQELLDKHNQIEYLETAVVLLSENEPIGCGCFKEVSKETIEIKRFYLKPSERGKSLAQKILLELEAWAIELGYSIVILETGLKQPEAMKFYSNNGYVIRQNYAPYIGNSNSVCMEKLLE